MPDTHAEDSPGHQTQTSKCVSNIDTSRLDIRRNLLNESLQHFAGAAFEEGAGAVFSHSPHGLCPADRCGELRDEILFNLLHFRSRAGADVLLDGT